MLERPGNKEIQLDLFLDYASNVKLYPKFQEYLRQSELPLQLGRRNVDASLLNGGAPSVYGEFRALNETGTIRRQENNGFGNLVR